MKKLFKDGFVFISDREVFEKRDIITEDGIIRDIKECTTVFPDADEVISLKGRYAIPGLVDVHTHGIGGYDFNSADENMIMSMRKKYALGGTTSIMATLASDTYDNLKKSISAISSLRNRIDNASVIEGIHLEGRYLSEKRRGAHNADLLAPPAGDDIASLVSEMLPPPFHVSAAYESADEKFYDCILSAGGTMGLAHTSASYEEAAEAVRKGVRSFTHTFNAMEPLHHRAPGGAAASMLCDDAYSEIICDGLHVHPAFVNMLQRTKPKDKIVLITDSMEATLCPDGEYKIAGMKVIVKDGKALTTDGALAGSTLTLIRALRNYMKFCSLPLESAVNAATLNPASMVKISDRCGTLRPGRRADMIILDSKETVNIADVYIRGERI